MSDWQLLQLLRGYWSLATIAALGLVGLIVLLSLLLAWRRHLIRSREAENRSRHPSAAAPVDVWRAGGRRLARLVAPPRPRPDGEDEAGIEPDEEDDEEDDDEEDDDLEWWQRSE